MRFIETPVFTRRVCNLISDESYRVVVMENGADTEDLTPKQVNILAKAVQEDLR